ncbi:MAG: phosphoadenylyl-sulfate reductase [Actinomycetota bacterium]|nr:phosphoadenylyl-sulfate reductase [Actinomycetota bacterium]
MGTNDESETDGGPGPGGPPDDLASEIAEADRSLEGAPAAEVLAWAVGRFGDRLALASSFQDCVLVDLAVRADPGIRVVFLDTGYHFPETLAYMRRVQGRYGLVLDVRLPRVPIDVTPCGAPGCCQVRKVEPLAAALAGSEAWVTGLKRVDTPERADAPVVGWDVAKGIVKVNPLACWSEEDVVRYVVDNDLPRHPLTYVGYTSIGCAPTTRPVEGGEDPRAGRWPGTDKTECGLHL